MTEQNKIVFTVNNIPSKKNHLVDGMIALKKIQHFSYALSDQIGLGYSSHVYKGKNDKTNEVVAVKVIDIKKQDDLHRQFTNDQVNILQKIKNASPQHLLKLEGVFKTKNNLYIITEFCQGKDVAKILRKKKYFSQSEAQGIMKQFLKGYGQLYRLKVVHRDLKLANIFVRKGRVVLADFGFAIDADRCTEKFDYNVGSPFYMPPQSLKFNRYSYKSDVWAIGVIAFELIYGQRPWKDKDDDILFDKITNTIIDQLFDPNVQVSEPYKQFIRECLRIDYDRRASPQFVINYDWNLAAQYIDGLQQHPHHHHKAISISKLPLNIYPASTKNVSYKPIQFDDIRQNKLAKNDSNQSPYSLMGIRQFSPHKQNLENRRKNLSSDNIIQKPEGNGNAYQYQYQTLLKKRNQRMSSVNQFSKQSFTEADTQKSILSQIQFCRFLNLIFDQISASALNKQLKQLRTSIAQKILNKIDFLSRIEQQQQNEVIPGLRKYINGQRWRTLNQMIGDYKNKYLSKYSNIQNRQSPFVSIQQVYKVLSSFKDKIREHQRIVQLLVYLYQVLELEQTKNIMQFAKQSRIQYLAENKNLTQSPGNTERLVRKYQYLGF